MAVWQTRAGDKDPEQWESWHMARNWLKRDLQQRLVSKADFAFDEDELREQLQALEKVISADPGLPLFLEVAGLACHVEPIGFEFMKVSELMESYAVGSTVYADESWTWADEARSHLEAGGAAMTELVRFTARNGISEPVLLGRDKVKEGHQHVVAALFLGIEEVPVEWA